jgi:glycosyltransferase involved in cell wall biosynthesis
MSLPGICIITETYYPVVGGGETQARTLAKGLRENGLDAIILTRRSDTGFMHEEQIDGIPVYRLPPTGKHHLKKWGLLLTSLQTLIRLRRDYDLIFVSGFRILGLPAVIVSKLLGKACVVKADSSGEMSGRFFQDGLASLGLSINSLPFRLFLWIRNNVLRRADGFVAISTEIAEELTAHGVDSSRIHSIPNSVDTKRFHPVASEVKVSLRRKLELPLDWTIVTYTGRIVSYKGLPLLLRVWRDFQRRHDNMLLLLVGTGGMDIHNCEDELKTYVDDEGLKDSVCFTGAVRNVNEYLQASDIFAFPTESEAFGISLIEAMACGLPSVASDVGGVKDILVTNQNGLVVDLGNFEQLIDALEQLSASPELRTTLGTLARHTVCDRYEADAVARQYTELFRRISPIEDRSV